jgi:PAS domain S-box-containing protein
MGAPRPSPETEIDAATTVADRCIVTGSVAWGTPSLRDLRELLDLATSTREADDVFPHIVALIERANSGVRSSVLLASEDRTHLTCVAAGSIPSTLRAELRRVEIKEGSCACSTAAARAQVVVVADVTADPLIAGLRSQLKAADIQSVWSHPIVGGAGQVVGTILNLRTTTGAPLAEEIELVATAAQCVALVVERAAAERRRLAQERNLSAILAHAQEAILRLDAEGRFLFVNPAAERIAGRTAADLLGRTSREVGFSDAICEAVERFLGSAATSSAPRHGELPFGDTRLDAVAVPEVDANGALAGVVVVARDITEQRVLEERIRQAEKMESLGRLAGGIAHDFNNILAAILGYSELVLTDVPARSEAADNIEQVLRASRRARDLVRQILAFSRKSEVTTAPLDVRFALRDALRLLRASLPATVELHERIAESPLMVASEASQISQIVLNLGTNAEYAMRRRGFGRLDVTLDGVNIGGVVGRALGIPAGRYVRLVMQDNGEGIPEEVLPKVFEPFFTTKEIGEGTGMGLAVVHGIVTAHGGAHRVESTVGRGTKFEVLLPRLATPAALETTRDPHRATGSGRVLIIDDEVAITSMLQRALPRRGFEVKCLTSPQEALEIFRADPTRFDVVVTDRTMPHMTGEALIHAMRALRPKLPVVLSSGRGHQRVEKGSGDSVVHLSKPFDANELVDAIERAVRGREGTAARLE